MKISFARWLSIAALPVIVVSLFAAIYFFKQSQNVVTLPDYGAAPSFELIDSSGTVFESKTLTGKPWVMVFLFTRCPDQCPLMVTKMKQLSKRVPNLRFVSVTADPDFDTPEVLAEYVARGVGPRNWNFLTGDKQRIKQIAAGFMTASPDDPGLHSTRFILVDRQGRIRGFYDSQNPQAMQTLAVDVRGL